MLLNVLSRKGDGCRAMQQLIARCHESPKAKKAHVKRAWQLFRSLVDRRIIEIVPTRSAAVSDPDNAVGEQFRPHPGPLPRGEGEPFASLSTRTESRVLPERPDSPPSPRGRGPG